MTTPADTTPRAFPLEGELALAEEHLRTSYDIAPKAFLDLLLADLAPRTHRMVGDVAVVDVQGPLDQRGGIFWDGYDSVTDRARGAFEDPKARAVVLALDSPGGVVAGNLDAAQQLRALADASGKPLLAHAGTFATSAAYALACAADHIGVTRDGAVGSVGVIATVADRTKMTAEMGLDVRVVRSGALKADPHPDIALTDASVARVRSRVMDLATAFAGWVAERRGQTTEAVLALQGATIYAPRALETGLADSVGTLADTITRAVSMADAIDRTKRIATMTEQAVEQLASLRAALGVETDQEIAAAIGVLRTRAEHAAVADQELAAVREQLAQRDAAAAAQAREAVLVRHRDRGALTPAMEADAAFVADLAPLSAESLDRVLSKLPGAPKAVTPKNPSGCAPEADDSDELTATDREWASRFGVKPEHMQRAVQRDRERAVARGLADTE